jgi:ABC-2 type transport system ATP-binding protein
MSLHVDHLTKKFARQTAVNNLSFEVAPGEIVGFLGPNGAGKSTTMKILTGFLPPTLGFARVAGIDVQLQPLRAKKHVGYLPEHNPLYTDMFVREYLHFAGRLHGLRGHALRERINQMVKLCGLEEESRKKIEALSKGYRQRVGLAQALLHNPEVLILDEPTTGLDPNQIIEIRQLIKHIAVDKTVLFSTHLMQEVQALCNRVVILHRGRCVANSTLGQLVQQSGLSARCVVEWGGSVPIEELQQLEGVAQVEQLATNRFALSARQGHDIRPAVSQLAAQRGYVLAELTLEEPSLEAIFKQLTRNPA